MHYLVAYDIADNRRRDQVVTILLDFGERVQESVFVCELQDVLRDRMRTRLDEALDPAHDHLLIVPLCAGCWLAVETRGPRPKPDSPSVYIY